MADIDKFEDFLDALNCANPDISQIKEAILKHPDWLKDDDKLQQFFPERSTEHHGLRSLGLEDTKKLSVVLKAAHELNKEHNTDGSAKFSDEQFKNLLDYKNPQTGETAIECIQNNQRIAQKKLDLPCVQQNDELCAKLSANLKVYGDTLDELQNLGIYKNERKMTMDEALTILNGEDNKSPLTVASPENEEGIAIGGEGNSQPLNIEARQPEQPLPQDEKIEGEGHEPGYDGKGSGPVKFTPVKEGDIVDYMFNEWFLASINWCGEKIFNWINRAFDDSGERLPSSFGSGRPQTAAQTPHQRTAPATPQQGNTPPTGHNPPPAPQQSNQQADLPVYNSPIEFMDEQNGYASQLTKNLLYSHVLPMTAEKEKAVMDNIGKTEDQWVLPSGITIPTAERQTLNKLYQQNPQYIQNMLENAKGAMIESTILASQIATLQYMQDHIDENINFNDPEVQEEIRLSALNWCKTLTKHGYASKNPQQFFAKMRKSIKTLNSHVMAYHTAKKLKEKAIAKDKVKAFNFTKEALLETSEASLLEAAQQKPVISTRETQNLERDKAVVNAGIEKNHTRRINLNRVKSHLQNLTQNRQVQMGNNAFPFDRKNKRTQR